MSGGLHRLEIFWWRWTATARAALDFAKDEARMRRLLRIHYGEFELIDGSVPRVIAKALDAYFKGDIEAIDSLSTATNGTAFQRDVWKALRAIPAGSTASYGRLAAMLGRATASRAVGAANGRNPIAIVVPCHRVIGADGSLTGYAGGVEQKRWLLAHEQRFAK
ncbi:MAG: methylated-DNA--[protein]-cysteine S-methyltransferase [Phycisphaerales bacterium]